MKYILTAADNNKTLDLRAGDELQITLDETPTTGYNWEVMNPAEPLYQIKKILIKYMMKQVLEEGAAGFLILGLQAAVQQHWY
jgi:predicted secreted protein